MKKIEPTSHIGKELYTIYEGYKGDLVFNKVYCVDGMYALKDPILQKNVSIYAVYENAKKRFIGFGLSTGLCCHGNTCVNPFTGIYHICHGNIELTGTNTDAGIIKKCEEVRDSLSIINTFSMPHGFMYAGYEELNMVLAALKNGYEIQDVPGFDKYLRKIL